jgi:hypothetical protein
METFLRAALLAAAVSAFVLLPRAANAQQTNSLEALTSSYEMARLEIGANCQQEMQKALRLYRKALDNLLADSKQKGDLDTYEVAAAEQKRFSAEETVPGVNGCQPAFAGAAQAYHKSIAASDMVRDRETAALQKRQIASLDGLIKQLMLADKIDEARAVKAERENTAAELDKLEATLPVAAKPPAPETKTPPAAEAKPAKKKLVPVGIAPFKRKSVPGSPF